jgi:GNAT superfamily N-acetyltransferase
LSLQTRGPLFDICFVKDIGDIGSMSRKAEPATFVLRHASETDIDRLMEIQFSAFRGDPYHEALYPGPHDSSIVRKLAGQRMIEDWRNTPDQDIVVCIHAQTEEILGFASWYFYLCERPREEWEKMPSITWAEGKEKKQAEAFMGATARMRMKTWGGRPHVRKYRIGNDLGQLASMRQSGNELTFAVVLGLLCVHREAQRQGVGAALVQWGLDRCIEENLTAYLEASSAGFPLYQKLGFSKIDTMTVKAENWDGDRDLQYVVMRKDIGIHTSLLL